MLELPVQRQAVEVCAADHHAGPIVARDSCRGFRIQAAFAGQRQAMLMLQAVRQAEQILISKRPAEQGHAPGQAIGHKAGGHGDGGVIQHVHKVGVVAQVRVALNGFGVQLVQGHWARVGRRQYAIQVGHDLIAACLERLQTILRAEGIDTTDGGCFFQHRLDHRQDGLRLLLNQCAGDAVAFCHPGAGIQQARSFEEGREVDFHRFAAQGFELLDGAR